MKLWEVKAHKIIGELCLSSYRQSNNGKRKKHTPYAVPYLAQDLIRCLGKRDEIRAKEIFMQLLDTPELGREL